MDYYGLFIFNITLHHKGSNNINLFIYSKGTSGFCKYVHFYDLIVLIYAQVASNGTILYLFSEMIKHCFVYICFLNIPVLAGQDTNYTVHNLALQSYTISDNARSLSHIALNFSSVSPYMWVMVQSVLQFQGISFLCREIFFFCETDSGLPLSSSKDWIPDHGLVRCY